MGLETEALAGVKERCLEILRNDLSVYSVEDLRAKRSELQAIETSLSIMRRISQGWLDISHAGLIDKTDLGGEAELSVADIHDLVNRLPGILSQASLADPSRLQVSSPTGNDHDVDLFEELNSVVSNVLEGKSVGELTNLEADQAKRITERLANFERELSDSRRKCHEAIDVIQEEIVRRYKLGKASADGWLK